MLEVLNIHTYYGVSHVLHGVSINLGKNEVIALIGRNGAGKTTAIHSIIGICQVDSGSILLEGESIVRLPVYKIVRKGISLVPQGKRIFPSLTVKENLEIGIPRDPGRTGWNLERIYNLFPGLKDREENRGNQLSGGEQQMLAIGRALMIGPKLLLMDEPSEGLAPLIVKQLGVVVKELRNTGLSILLVEQNIGLVLNAAVRTYVISKGKIVYESTPDELWNNEQIKSQYLGV